VPTTAGTVQYIDKNTVTFLFTNTVYSAHNENKIEYADIDMCIDEPLVRMTPYFYGKMFSSDKSNRLLEQVPRGCSIQRFPL